MQCHRLVNVNVGGYDVIIADDDVMMHSLHVKVTS